MGGCRCTYRNCTVRSDGKTHLFHYPVFDRVRCHQWLVNADRLDLVNLKVSQLKNRVVCQHHFRDECFMNFKKDKLRFDAVPTLDGPFCDAFNWVSSKLDKREDNSKLYSLTLEDIDEINTHDKEFNVSKKYVDFLTNGELSDLDCLNQPSENTIITCKENELLHNNISDKKTNKNTKSANMINIEIPPVKHQLQSKYDTGTLINTQILQNESFPKKAPKNSQRHKINIISEKKISDPVQIEGELTPISPSRILIVPCKRQCPKYESETIVGKNTESLVNIINNSTLDNLNNQVIDTYNQIEYIDTNQNISREVPLKEKNLITNENESIQNFEGGKETFSILNNTLQQVIENTDENQRMVESQLKQQTENSETLVNILNNSFVKDFKPGVIHMEEAISAKKKKTSLKKSKLNHHPNIELSPSSLLKNKIPPERIAAIEEKRKFNMKLKDIIEAGLSKLQEDDNTPKTYKTNQQKASSFLSKDHDLPSFQEYSFASLESRIKRMEDTLLSKIEQNSNRIANLSKKMSGQHSAQTTTFTQTAADEEAYKKYLYHEISKYLSPATNSMVYEELFLSKFKCSLLKKSQSPKRRKRR